jgi:hypothetical protein
MSDAPSRSPSRRGRTLKLYLADGTPSGVITAELGVSSVRAAVASRTALPELIRREEASRTGVYLLVGPDPDLPGRQLVYVGEGDQVKSRLAAHDADEAKEFFTRAVLIVSKDENLTNGSTFLEVTKPDFENFQIAVPSLEQQRLIADALDAEAMEITLLEQRDGLLQSQKRGLMQKLLTGEWRLDERFDPPMLAPRAALAGGAA